MFSPPIKQGASMSFVLPPRSKVEHLDREIASEGEGVVLSDGEKVSFAPPPVKSAVPDISNVKSVQRYFHRVGFTPFPCWLYHPSKGPVQVYNQDEALEYGVVYRETTAEERARYGRAQMYDWREDTEWRPNPFPKDVKFDPHKQHAGKNVVWPEKTGAAMQDALIEKLIPQVAASVAAALKISAPASPAGMDAKEWSEFQEFMAWKNAGEATREAVRDVTEANAPPAQDKAEADERAMWVEEAQRLGVKVDGRWSPERLKAEIDKAAA